MSAIAVLVALSLGVLAAALVSLASGSGVPPAAITQTVTTTSATSSAPTGSTGSATNTPSTDTAGTTATQTNTTTQSTSAARARLKEALHKIEHERPAAPQIAK
jgi:hypothetical protein